jgi:lipid-binding SYLF domain-containing protein
MIGIAATTQAVVDLHETLPRDGRAERRWTMMIMNSRRFVKATLFAFATALYTLGAVGTVHAATAEDLNRDASQALQTLYKTSHTAEVIAHDARAILVFPSVIKAGLVFGGSYGEGALMKNGNVVDYFNSVSGSWGLQAGAQSYSYVVFLMSPKAIEYLEKSEGWELGVGPTVVLVNEGVAKNLSSTTLKDDAYAFIFSQRGLMAGISIEGTKISQIKR